MESHEPLSDDWLTPMPDPEPGPAPEEPAEVASDVAGLATEPEAAVVEHPTPLPVPTVVPPPERGPASPRPPSADSGLLPPAWLILILLLAFLIVLAIGIGALVTARRNRPSGGAEPATVEKIATFLLSPTPPTGQSVVLENGNPLPALVPATLIVGDQTFSVVPVVPEQGRWPVPAQDTSVAVWIYGTVVNYVVGLPYTDTTATLLNSLTATARLTLTLSNGAALVFGEPQAQHVSPSNVAPLEQQQPGLTLALLRETQAERLVVKARYLPEESQTAGTQQRAAGLTVTVLKSGLVDGTADGGARYFLVEYRIVNERTTAVDAALLGLSLEDGQGQRYLLNAEAAAKGERGALTGSIAAGASVEGSAGYLVPPDLTPPLTWVFRPDPTGGETASFVLPYQKPAPGPAQPQVTLTGAFVDQGRGMIVVNGVARNTGESPLTVNPTDVALTSGAGRSELEVATPPLPWTIQPGGEQSFELQFVRPTGVASVLLNLLGFTFQVEGLP